MPSISEEIYDVIYGVPSSPADRWDWFSDDNTYFDPETGHPLVIALKLVDTNTFEFFVSDVYYDKSRVILEDSHFFATENYNLVCQAILLFLSDDD